MPRTVDPRRRCLPLAEWPAADRAAWEAAMRAARGRFSARGPAAGLAPKTIEKAQEGYGRWLGFLRHEDDLDPDVGPLARLSEARAAAFLDALRALGNRDYTIVGRFLELQSALRIMVPGADVGWLGRPGGVPLRQRLAMQNRSFRLHHSSLLYAWGLDMAERAVTLTAPCRRQVMLRDGVLIALLAAAGPRRRSVQVMRLGQQIRFDGTEWWMTLDVPDIKTDRPHDMPLPAGLTPWMDRYMAVERRELLAGRAGDAMWVNWSGKPLGEAGIEKRIRWWSAKQFGAADAFGVHRFRHCIGTTAPLMFPDKPGVGAGVLGISGPVFAKNYDRGLRAAAGRDYLATLDDDRTEARAFLQRVTAKRGSEEEP